MSSFADEKTNGTLKLLMKSPIRSKDIIIGKFLSCSLLILILLTSSLIFPIFINYHGDPDWGLVLSSYGGLFLLSNTYIAFCLWLSIFCDSPFTSFLSSIFGLLIIYLTNLFTPLLKGDSLGASALSYISTTDHFQIFLKGATTVSDLTYFFSSTALFLFFATLSLDSLRWR